MTTKEYENYYVPAQSHWPIVGAVALFLLAIGAGNLVSELHKHEPGNGKYVMFAGAILLITMLFGWFNNVINESMSGKYSHQLDHSFRQAMSWFIFSEVMFFAAFFGTLLYARMLSVPWLGGAGNNAETAAILWPHFTSTWPLIKTPGGTETHGMGWYGLPLLNTIILMSSSITAQFAHVALEKDNRPALKVWLALTILLGFTFLFFQFHEYAHGYSDEMKLYLSSGIYGSTFYMLTGFHGLHVTLGATMLTVVFIRVLKGHFTPTNNFAFLAASWYWHFVDVVWVMLFVFVYVL